MWIPKENKLYVGNILEQEENLLDSKYKKSGFGWQMIVPQRSDLLMAVEGQGNLYLGHFFDDLYDSSAKGPFNIH